MSLVRNLGLDGAPSHLPATSARRRVEREDIAFANANRHRLGWQTLATLRGVNRDDLRRACESAATPAAVAAPHAGHGDAGADMAPGDRLRLRMLRAIDAGDASPMRLTLTMNMAASGVGNHVHLLKRQGYVAGDARAGGWTVTARGRRALVTGVLAHG